MGQAITADLSTRLAQTLTDPIWWLTAIVAGVVASLLATGLTHVAKDRLQSYRERRSALLEKGAMRYADRLATDPEGLVGARLHELKLIVLVLALGFMLIAFLTGLTFLIPALVTKEPWQSIVLFGSWATLLLMGAPALRGATDKLLEIESGIREARTRLAGPERLGEVEPGNTRESL